MSDMNKIHHIDPLRCAMTGFLSLLFWGIVLLVPISGCSKKAKTPDAPIIATVGSKVITFDDVRFRANMTVRHPRIQTPNAALNNLIAEKLFVLEDGENSAYLREEGVQAYIKGIREQAMREALYNELAVKPVKIDTTEMSTALRLSQRSYDVEFFTINNPDINARVEKRLDNDPGARSAIFDELKELGKTAGCRRRDRSSPIKQDSNDHDADQESANRVGSRRRRTSASCERSSEKADRCQGKDVVGGL
jgi:hypothetical protein